ncbi:MAG TPA: hypothetical protein VFG09_12605 [Thermodesulfovibrionales bacterium]|nr:hypothetical protein [Thermodesulfovibrionales bacterium]
MRTIACLILFGFCVAVSPVRAEDVFDGTKPLLCASIEALDCDPGVECVRGLAEDMGAPKFVRVDFSKKEIRGPVQTAKILSMEKDDHQIVLQGYEIGMGWTFAIDRATGDARISFAGGNETFIIFGACTSNP